jgi:hypothetical protein
MATLSELRTKVRQRADMVNSTFVEDDELDGYINAAGAELHDLLVTRYEDYFTGYEDFTITSGNTYDLPSTILKIRGLDYSLGGDDYATLRPWNFADRNRLNEKYDLYGSQGRRYRLMSNKIYIMPAALGPGTYRLWAIQAYVDMTNDGSNLIEVIGNRQNWYEYVVVDAAIRCLQKEESDVSVLMAQKAMLAERIRSAASGRDAGEPERITELVDDWDLDE